MRALLVAVSVLAMAVASASASAREPRRPSDCVAELAGLAGRADDIGSRRFELYDAIVVSNKDDADMRNEGCGVFKRLVPTYRRLQALAQRCLRTSPGIAADGFLRDVRGDLVRAQTFLLKARCG